MKNKIKIGLPMEYEDDKNIIRTGLWLKEYEVEALEKRLNKCNQLQSNWNSLREWLEQEYAIVKANRIEEPNNPVWYIKTDEREKVLDKMNELEGKDKE